MLGTIHAITKHPLLFTPLLVQKPLPHDQRQNRCCSEAVILAAREHSRKIVHDHQEVAVRRVEELHTPQVSSRVVPPPDRPETVEGQFQHVSWQ
jgi:hypothetical protein